MLNLNDYVLYTPCGDCFFQHPLILRGDRVVLNDMQYVVNDVLVTSACATRFGLTDDVGRRYFASSPDDIQTQWLHEQRNPSLYA